MKLSVLIFCILILLVNCQNEPDKVEKAVATFCNPLNINYRFGLEQPSRREAADPTVILFKDKYLLFASKSGGYWYSDDLLDWNFVETNDIPTEDYAPTAIVIHDTVYFMGSSHQKNSIYKSADPLNGKWQLALDSIEMPAWDPAFFLDDDNRLYLYWGCSNENPIYGVELDFENNFAFMGQPKELLHANTTQNGWEVPGDYNTRKETNPWIEGAWVNKYNGKYYLQYSGPGTEFKSYSDGVYIADDPLGPYTLQQHNPFAYKPEGFIAGAGHGSTFKDKFGNYWHIGTGTISVKHMFERRLVLYPAFFDNDGVLFTSTKFGDYPIKLPENRVESFEDYLQGWMLLSFNKKVEVSSSIDTLSPQNMNDENIRTYWAAESGDSSEFAIMDLGGEYDVHAVQVNFAEHNTKILGRRDGAKHRYLLETSMDGETWSLLVDKSQNETDNSHDYIQLKEKVNCRYLKIKNIEVPGGNFALSGFRIFGIGNGKIPDIPENFTVKRDPKDKRSVQLSWEPSTGATGYNISYGTNENKLYQNYIVYKDTLLKINSLNVNQTYYFTIKAFNESGISQKGDLTSVE